MKLYTAKRRTVAYTTDLKWRTEWCVYKARRRVCTATSERVARQIARALNDANPQVSDGSA